MESPDPLPASTTLIQEAWGVTFQAVFQSAATCTWTMSASYPNSTLPGVMFTSRPVCVTRKFLPAIVSAVERSVTPPYGATVKATEPAPTPDDGETDTQLVWETAVQETPA